MILVHKSTIKSKLENLFAGGITKNGLLKPTLGVQLWGPWFKLFDIDEDADASAELHESEFSTFRHVKNEDCPSYTDNSKERNFEAHFNDKKAYYPCNFGSCLEECV